MGGAVISMGINRNFLSSFEEFPFLRKDAAEQNLDPRTHPAKESGVATGNNLLRKMLVRCNRPDNILYYYYYY